MKNETPFTIWKPPVRDGSVRVDFGRPVSPPRPRSRNLYCRNRRPPDPAVSPVFRLVKVPPGMGRRRAPPKNPSLPPSPSQPLLPVGGIEPEGRSPDAFENSDCSAAGCRTLSWAGGCSEPSRRRARDRLARNRNVRRLARQPRIWIWGDEILVGFSKGYYKDLGDRNHIDREKPEYHMLARSFLSAP